MRAIALATALLSAFTSIAYAQVAVKSGMTADSQCGAAGYCFTALYSPSTKMINYTLVVQQSGQSGWWGVGQGSRMAGANMAINWANADGSLTTSHRSTPAQIMPLESRVTVQAFSRNTDVSKGGSSQTVWSWNMPVPAGAQMNAIPHIFAHSRTNPPSSDSGAMLVKHNYDDDDITLDLTKAYKGEAPAGLTGAAATTAGSTSSSTGGNREMNLYNRIFITHMVFMIIGWMICFPLGILVARYGRTFFTWFPTHRIIQSVGFLFVFIGFFLAIGGVSVTTGSHLSNTHEKLGLSLFILIFCQAILGAASHSLKRRTGSRILGFLHIPLGLILFALSVWQIHEGFEIWQWGPPDYASYIIYAWAGFMALLYLVGFALLPREIRQNRDQDYAQKP